MISALVVAYDSGATLGRCLASLPPPSPDRLEIVVVDNGSSDGSMAEVRRENPAARVLELGANLGFGAAVNRGAAEARGDELLLLNADAWLLPGALEALERRLVADPHLAWVAPRLYYPDGRPQFVWEPQVGVLGEAARKVRNRFERREWSHTLLPRALTVLLGPGWFTAACALVRHTAFDEVGGFDERFFLYFEDSDLCLRLRRAGWRLALEPAARVVHVSAGSGGGRAAAAAYRRSQLAFYEQHRPRWARRVLRRYLGWRGAL
jgi:GT2 family glycosyltransferase